VIGFLIALMWPLWTLVPRQGLDPSWQTGLSWARELGLRWGADVLFTYGPLGYLLIPETASPWQPELSVVVQVAAVMAVAIAVAELVLLRRTADWRWAWAVSAVVTVLVLVTPPGPIPLAIITGSVLAFYNRSLVTIALIGAGLAVIGHMKLSDAVLVLGFALACSIGARRGMGPVVLLATTAPLWLALWLVSGHGIGDLTPYLNGVSQLVAGYPHAMSLELPGFQWHYVAAFVVTVMLLVQLRESTRDLSRIRSLCLAVGVVWVWWVAFREGFVRHDGHAANFFSYVLAMATLLVIVRPIAARWRWGALASALSYLVVVSIGVAFISPIDRTPSLRALGTTLGAMSSQTYEDQLQRESLVALHQAYALTDELLEALGARPTAADPWDVSALRATNVTWEPVPVFQLYAAFTPALDELNARDLEETPRQILRSVPYGATDGKNPYWQSPRYQRIVYCSYGVVFDDDRWQVLQPSAVDRCGVPTPAGEVAARANEPVPVPSRAGAITLATIHPTQSALDAAVSFLFKPSETFVAYGDRSWRLGDYPAGVGLMLNGPLAHRSFPRLPGSPFPTIAITRDATIEFAYVDVPIARLNVVADATVPEVTDQVEVDEVRDLVVAASGSCLTLVPTAEDPGVSIYVPNGSQLFITSGAPGVAQLFLDRDADYSEEASVRVELTSGVPTSVTIPGDGPETHWYVRVDPPAQGTTRLCGLLPG
jgi:hypothetical protein